MLTQINSAYVPWVPFSVSIPNCEMSREHPTSSGYARPLVYSVKFSPRVAIIGAGIAGLGAGQALLMHGIRPTIYEGRKRAGGRCLSTTADEQSNALFSDVSSSTTNYNVQGVVFVDCGASTIHGVQDDDQLVYKMSRRDKIRAPVVSGCNAYESLSHAAWFRQNGETVNQRKVAKVSMYYDRVKAKAIQRSSGYSIERMYASNVFEEIICASNIEDHLTEVERRMLMKFVQKDLSYASIPTETAMLRLSWEQVQPAEQDDDAEKALAKSAVKSLSRNKPRSVMGPANNQGDRIVLDGYGPWLVQRMIGGLNIRYNVVAKQIKGCEAGNTRVVYVETADGDVAEYDFVILAVPLGVLLSSEETASIRIFPDLQPEKVEMLRSMKMGIHNKVIMRFGGAEVFWPEFVPQLNVEGRIKEAGMQFANLHAYGKTGIIVAHLFGWTWKESGYEDKTANRVTAQFLYSILIQISV